MWQNEIIKIRTKKDESAGAAASLVLMYLAFGKENWPYKMATNFEKMLTEEHGWSNDRLEKFHPLTKHNQLHALLKAMKKKNFLTSKDEKFKGRLRYLYDLNEVIVYQPHPLSRIIPDPEEEKKAQLVRDFLDALNRKSREEIKTYFKEWSSIKKFDFYTFLGFLKMEATKLGKKEVIGLISMNIDCIKKIEKEAKLLKLGANDLDKNLEDDKARGIYKDFSPAESLLDEVRKARENRDKS